MELNDIVTKNFESYADVAADIVNALLHEGTVVVTGEEMLQLQRRVYMQTARIHYTINWKMSQNTM